MEKICIGWDGRSNPMYDYRDACGCRWMEAEKIHLSFTCAPHFAEAVKAQTAENHMRYAAQFLI